MARRCLPQHYGCVLSLVAAALGASSCSGVTSPEGRAAPSAKARSAQAFSIERAHSAWTVGTTLFAITHDPLVMVRLDMRTGAVERTQLGPEVAHGVLGAAERGKFQGRDGACVLHGTCSAQLLDCETGKPIGPLFRGDKQTGAGAPTSGPTLCRDFHIEPIGRNDTSIFVQTNWIDEATSLLPEGEHAIVAIDRTTGAVRFVKPIGWEFGVRVFGLGPEGKVIALMNERGLLFSYDTTNGKLLRMILTAMRGSATEFAVWADASRLLVSRGGVAEMIDLVTAQEGFRVQIGQDEIAIPSGSPKLADLEAVVDQGLKLRLIDATDGRTLRVLRLPVGTRLVSSSEGTLRAPALGRAWTATLDPVDLSKLPESAVRIVKNDAKTEVRAAKGDRPLLESKGDAWLVGASRDGDAVVAAVGLSVLESDTGPFDVKVFRID